jgi:peroxiredoxin
MSLRHVIRLSPLIFLGVASFALAQEAPKKPEQPAVKTEVVTEFNPVPHLIRDPAVRADLKLTPEQTQTIDQMLLLYGIRLFPLRDAGPLRGGKEWNATALDLQLGLDSVLTPKQSARLDQLKLQSRGLSGFLSDDLAKKLELSAEQKTAIQGVFDKTKRELASIQATAKEKPDEGVAKQAKLQQQMHREVIAVLKPEQQKKVALLIGKPFDMTEITPNAGRPPELRGITDWINSEPIKLADLRGKVVIVHFYAFGCINCIHNYPHYKKWAAEFPSDKVAIIGIHTPETENERDIEKVRAAAKKEGLTFPIAVDGKSETWKAWNNNVWPAVYVLDQNGNVRFWWYGELDWKGAGGQLKAEQIVKALLNVPAEKK